MIITVQLFGPARDAAGRDSIEVDVVEGASVSDLYDSLRRVAPALSSLLDASRLAIDLRYASMEESIPSGAEIALIPPVAGG